MREVQPLAAASSTRSIHRKTPRKNPAPVTEFHGSRSAGLDPVRSILDKSPGIDAPRSPIRSPATPTLDDNQWPVIRGQRLSVRLAGSALDGSRLDLLPAKKSPHNGGLSFGATS